MTLPKLGEDPAPTGSQVRPGNPSFGSYPSAHVHDGMHVAGYTQALKVPTSREETHAGLCTEKELFF